MNIRELKEKDAPLMLEWMHDQAVVRDMRTPFAEKTLRDCMAFIQYSNGTQTDLNLAVVDDNDEYMGTVSLKHIADGMAEFGITVRKCAMRKGYSEYAMREIIRIGFREKNLHKIYWCVSPANARAIRFYDKNGYGRIREVPAPAWKNYSEDEIHTFVWYEVNNSD